MYKFDIDFLHLDIVQLTLTQELLKPQCETSMFHLIALGLQECFWCLAKV